MSHDYCDTCNRVRLSADGRLKLCLFGDHHIDFRTPLRAGAGAEALQALFRGSMYVKPERHHLDVGQTASAMRALSEIGG
jgi:cyclic pyranopterin phosphate synthase